MKMAELDSFKGRLDGFEDKLASEVQSQLVELQREPSDTTGCNLEQLVQSIIAVESRIPTEVDIANEVNMHFQELKLPAWSEFEALQKTMSEWENRIAVEVRAGLESFVPEICHRLGLESLDGRVLAGWESRLAQFDAARIEVEALIQRVDKHQEHLEELSVNELKQLLEGFVGEVNGRLEGHSRDFEEAAHARQALIERIGALEVKLQNDTVDMVPDDELQAMLACCSGGQDDSAVLSPRGGAELGHRLREAQLSLADRIEALCERIDGMHVQHAKAVNAQQALQRRVDSLQQASAAAARQPAQRDFVTAGSSSDGEPDRRGDQLHRHDVAEAWHKRVRKDLALVQRRIFAELRAESQLWLMDQQWAIATLDERISLTEQRLSWRIDELVQALGRGRQHQQVQVAEATALERLAAGTAESWFQPLGDASTLERTADISPPTADSAPTMAAPSPRRQVQFQVLGFEEAQAQLSPADDKSEA
jgi:hypothetical protein